MAFGDCQTMVNHVLAMSEPLKLKSGLCSGVSAGVLWNWNLVQS